jgi:hypothetical protein
MPKSIKDNLTNILILLVTAFGGTLGAMILSRLDKQGEDIVLLKVYVGASKIVEDTNKEKNQEQDKEIEKLRNAKGIALFKHEQGILKPQYER